MQHSSIINQKQIKIKPIEFKRKSQTELNSSEVLEDEMIAKRIKLEEMQHEFDRIKQQSETLLSDTQKKIVQEKEKWEEEKQQLIAEAKEVGHQEGFAAGEKESLNQYAELLKKANDVVHSATTDYHDVLESSEEVILQLAIQSAEKIIQRVLEEKPEVFIDIVKTAIKDIKEQSIISIYVHPDNYELVLSQKDELSRLLDSESKLTILVKDNLKSNHCLIEHPFGQIDASIDTQLEQLRALLHEVNMENKQ